MEAKKTVKERCPLKRSAFFAELDVATSGMKRVLSVSADCKTTGEECADGEIRISGRIEYKILFENEEGNYDCMNAAKDFLEKIVDKEVTPSSVCCVELIAVDNEYSGDAVLKIRTTVEVSGWFVRDRELLSVIEDGDDSLMLKKNTAEIESIVVLPTALKEISKDVELIGGIDKLLYAQTKINVNSVACATEIAYVDAELSATLLYVKDSNLFQETVVAPFAAELVSGDITAESEVFASGSALSVNVTVADEKTVVIETTAMIKGTLAKVEEYEYTADAYSLKNDLDVKLERYKLDRTACKETLSDKLSGSLRIDSEQGAMRAVIGSTEPIVAGLSLKIEDGRILVAEGVISARVLYLNEHGTAYGALIEAPFQLKGARECVMSEVLTAKACVHNFTARIRMGDEIEFSATLEISVEGTNPMYLECMTSLETLGERTDDGPAISLYIASEGESLWNVAKSLLTDEATLMEQNPDLELPLTGGEHIIVYKEL